MRRERLAPYLSLAAALVLASLPWPRSLAPWAPLWVPLVLFFWILVLPERVGIVTAWATGLLDDVVHLTPLGEHAAILAVLAYVVERWRLEIRLAPLGQQMAVFFLLFTAERLLEVWLTAVPLWSPGVFLPPLVTALLWPLAQNLLLRLAPRGRLLL
ncbi:MAG: rod shape-determining protein MreD [Gammaproteobacteria bacterium]|jgi:rod shape-determining protein MreD|nr:rod shape-determining protein MreD [Gammaproteobacteria bacterium]